MTNPQFVEEKHLSLVDVKIALEKIQERDGELNYLSNKAKEYLDAFAELSPKEKDILVKSLIDLNIIRLKEEHIMKIVDFLPKTIEDLRVVLQAYPLSMPKKDQESIVGAVKAILET